MDTVNTFSGGMNKDLDKSLLKPHQTFDIQNFRLVSRDGGSTGALENIMGNILSTQIPSISNMYFITLNTIPPGGAGQMAVFGTYTYWCTVGTTITDLYNQMAAWWGTTTAQLFLINNTIVIYDLVNPIITPSPISGPINVTIIPAQTNPRIIGYANIRQSTILFTTSCVNEDDATIQAIGYGQLWKLTYDDTQNIPSPTLTLLYNNLLSFSDFHPIEALGRFENEAIQKVYWVDDFNYFRFCNTADPNLMTYNPSMLDAIADSVLTAPTLNSVTGGGFYKAGIVQYAYQLYSQYGSQTVFSSCSNTIHIVKDSENVSESYSYSGSPITTDCGKAVIVDINNIDQSFSNIRVIAIFWDTLNVTPIINYVYDDIIPSSHSLQVKDNGVTNYGTLTAAEFLSQGGALVAAKTLATKYDYLFLGNIKQPSWDIDFDARAYRFDKYGNAIVNNVSGIPLHIDTSQPRTGPTPWGVPLTHDCINPFNDDPTLISPYQCMKGSTPTYWTFGGNGPNVSYRFNVNPFIGYDFRSDGDNLASQRNTYINNAGSAASQSLNGVTYPNNSFASEASPEIDGLTRSYQRDEIYRFGLVFWNNKCQSSFVHWIADIRMPHQISMDAVSTGSTRFSVFITNDTYQMSEAMPSMAPLEILLHHLGLVFTIDISSLSPTDLAKIKSISIVRCKRQGDDRTVVASGVIYPTYNNPADSGYENPIPLGFVPGCWNGTSMFEFNSPEINFNKNIEWQTGDYIDLIGWHSITSLNTAVTESVYKAIEITPYNMATHQLWGTQAAQIADVSFGGLDSINTATYRNYYNGVGLWGAYHGTTLIFQTSATEYAPSVGNGQMVVANYKRKLISQYGGNTFDARYGNEYIECMRFDIDPAITSYTKTVFGGDTFLGMYDYLRFAWDTNLPAGGNTLQEVNFFPTESSVNLWLRMDRCFSKLNGIMPQSYMLQESFADGVAMFGSTNYPPGATDLYLYNTVYSQQNTLQAFYPKPFNFQDISLKDVELICSNQKTNGEKLDSWATFPVNNTKEVDANYGPINKLINFKNQLFFFQDKAFGIQYVLPRSLISDNNVSELVLGTGTVLDKHDYISNETGCMHQWGICNSKDSIAWFDMNKKKLFRYHGGTQALSDIKGMQSFFADNLTGGILSSHSIPTSLITTPTYGDNPIHQVGMVFKDWAGINCVYDDRYNEYVFTFSNTKANTSLHNKLPVYNYFTVAFTEPLEAFSSFYSLNPAIYIKTWNKLLTTPKNAPNQIWLQDYGDFGSFYGKIYDSEVDYYVKENYRYTKVFDSLDYTCDVSTFASNGNEIVLLEEGLNKVRFSNSYQNTDWYDLLYYSGWSMPPLLSNQIPEVRRETCWGIAVPRNAVLFNAPSDPDIFEPANLDQTRPFRERLRDNYMFVNLVYHNADPITGLAKNYRCVLPYVVSRYRPSAR